MGIKWQWVLLLFFVLSSCADKPAPQVDGTKLDGVMQELVWCGDENQIIIIRTETNSVYRSENRGASFKKITKHMQKAADEIVDDSAEIGDVTNIIKSEANNTTIVFIGNKGVMWVSTNCGATMTALNKDFKIQMIKLHPTEPSWLMAVANQECENPKDKNCLAGNHALYLTQDLGQNWKLISRNVNHVEWPFNLAQIDNGIPSKRIYATLMYEKTPPKLIYTDDFFRNTTLLVENCLQFKLRAYYLFAMQSTEDYVTNMLVSNLPDKFSVFYKTMFPFQKIRSEEFHILDTSENSVFVFVKRKYGSTFRQPVYFRLNGH